MGEGGAAEGDAPPPAPRPSPGLDRAFEKAALLERLTTLADHVAEETMRHVYSATTSLVQPGGSMAHLLIDTSVGCSVVVPQVIAALDGVAGLMADVHAADADELLPLFVKAAIAWWRHGRAHSHRRHLPQRAVDALKEQGVAY